MPGLVENAKLIVSEAQTVYAGERQFTAMYILTHLRFPLTLFLHEPTNPQVLTT